MLKRLLKHEKPAPASEQEPDDELADTLAGMLEGRIAPEPIGVLDTARDHIGTARDWHQGEINRLKEEIEILETDTSNEVAKRRAVLSEHEAVLASVTAYESAQPSAAQKVTADA